ncbi:MAG TPA: Flp pilus assembly protein CpaB [Candidatus Limnocylindrales bacterium]
MRRSNRLILLIGVVLAIVAFIGIVLIFQGSSGTQQAAPKNVPTVYAKVDIPFGTTVTADKVETREVDPSLKQADSFSDPGDVVGKIATTNIVAGQRISTSNFAQGAAQAAIAQNVPKGLNAVAIQVDQVSGVGTLINVGDHVDVVVGFDKHNWLGPVASSGPQPSASVAPVTVADQATSVKLLVQDVQVVGTLLPPAPTPTNGAQASQAPNTALTGASEIVIVAVTPQQAEVIKFAQMEGSISLTLSSPKDFVDASGNPVVPPAAKTTGIVLKNLLDDYGVLVPQLQTVTLRTNR